MSGYYDRQGNPITVTEWMTLLDQPSARRVARTEVGGFTVSTVFLGLNQQLNPDAVPLIFETMVFRGELNDECDFIDVDRARYSTEQQAIDGHAAMVARVEAGEFS